MLEKRFAKHFKYLPVLLWTPGKVYKHKILGWNISVFRHFDECASRSWGYTNWARTLSEIWIYIYMCIASSQIHFFPCWRTTSFPFLTQMHFERLNTAVCWKLINLIAQTIYLLWLKKKQFKLSEYRFTFRLMTDETKWLMCVYVCCDSSTLRHCNWNNS